MADKHETHATEAKKPEPTKAMAGKDEKSVTEFNMSGSPLPVIPVDPVDYKAEAEARAKVIQSTVPLMMDDERALAFGREIESRYLPPAPPPSVLDQVNAMNEQAKSGKSKAEKPAPTPPPQPAPHATHGSHHS